MADPTRPVSSFLPSPRFFNGFFSPKTLITDSEPSPTSILDNPLKFNKNRIKPTNIFQEFKNPSEKLDHEGIALALIEEEKPNYETLNNNNINNNNNKPNTISRKLLFASNLKIQIPLSSNNLSSSTGSPESPGDYGIKTRNSQISGAPTPTGFGSPKTFTGHPLSLSEMELLEEYTRVISHGPNPKTTHIYDNCVVESCCGVIGFGSGSPELFKKPGPKSKPCESFLSLCHTCNKNLGEGNDIFMYRGEKAFCSEECRCQEMVLDGLMMNS